MQLLLVLARFLAPSSIRCGRSPGISIPYKDLMIINSIKGPKQEREAEILLPHPKKKIKNCDMVFPVPIICGKRAEGRT